MMHGPPEGYIETRPREAAGPDLQRQVSELKGIIEALQTELMEQNRRILKLELVSSLTRGEGK